VKKTCNILRTSMLGFWFVGMRSLAQNQITNTQVQDSVGTVITNVFQTQRHLDPRYLTDLSLGLKFETVTNLNVTFLGESSGYKNTFGLFKYKADGSIGQKFTIFQNASGTGESLAGGGSLNYGDRVNLGTFEAGTRIGFWIQTNGYTNPKGTVFYSEKKFNQDGISHFASAYDSQSGSIVFGFEDIKGGGDSDYNDLLFSINAATKTGLVETVSAASIAVVNSQQLHKAHGMVTRNLPVVARISGLDEIGLSQFDAGQTTGNTLFEGGDDFRLESNHGVLIQVSMSPLTNANNEQIIATASLENNSAQLMTEANRTHNGVHRVFVVTESVDLANVSAAGSFIGTLYITISSY